MPAKKSSQRRNRYKMFCYVRIPIPNFAVEHPVWNHTWWPPDTTLTGMIGQHFLVVGTILQESQKHPASNNSHKHKRKERERCCFYHPANIQKFLQQSSLHVIYETMDPWWIVLSLQKRGPLPMSPVKNQQSYFLNREPSANI